MNPAQNPLLLQGWSPDQITQLLGSVQQALADVQVQASTLIRAYLDNCAGQVDCMHRAVASAIDADLAAADQVLASMPGNMDASIISQLAFALTLMQETGIDPTGTILQPPPTTPSPGPAAPPGAGGGAPLAGGGPCQTSIASIISAPAGAAGGFGPLLTPDEVGIAPRPGWVLFSGPDAANPQGYWLPDVPYLCPAQWQTAVEQSGFPPGLADAPTLYYVDLDSGQYLGVPLGGATWRGHAAAFLEGTALCLDDVQGKWDQLYAQYCGTPPPETPTAPVPVPIPPIGTTPLIPPTPLPTTPSPGPAPSVPVPSTPGTPVIPGPACPPPVVQCPAPVVQCPAPNVTVQVGDGKLGGITLIADDQAYLESPRSQAYRAQLDALFPAALAAISEQVSLVDALAPLRALWAEE